MVISKEIVLAHVTANGPIVAAKIASDLGSDSFLVGAFLSELLEQKSLFLTKSSAAGSPLYYVQSQIAELVVLRDKLKEKDRRTFDLLKEKGVVRDDEVEPLTRVSLQNLPDFAVSLTIKLGDEMVKFWKWYLLSNEEVVQILQTQYKPKPAPKQESETTPVSAQPQQESLTENAISSQNFVSSLVGAKKTGEIISQIEAIGIRVKSSIDIKKNTETDCILQIPHALGIQTYFVKIFCKKKITETDLSNVYMQSSLKQLPACVITTGVLTKKAELLKTGDLASMLLVQLGE